MKIGPDLSDCRRIHTRLFCHDGITPENDRNRELRVSSSTTLSSSLTTSYRGQRRRRCQWPDEPTRRDRLPLGSIVTRPVWSAYLTFTSKDELLEPGRCHRLGLCSEALHKKGVGSRFSVDVTS